MGNVQAVVTRDIPPGALLIHRALPAARHSGGRHLTVFRGGRALAVAALPFDMVVNNFYGGHTTAIPPATSALRPNRYGSS
jgi:hypothetical protein